MARALAQDVLRASQIHATTGGEMDAQINNLVLEETVVEQIAQIKSSHIRSAESEHTATPR